MTTVYTPSTSIAQTIPPTEARALLDLLIVDDDRFVRKACREAAMALGYSAKSTDSFDQALWQIESSNIDVVFLSAKATDFISKFRQFKEKRPGIEIIALTSNESMRFAIEAIKAGVYEVISKPFGLAEVKRVLFCEGKHSPDCAGTRRA